jgi:hypothetical protein
MLRWLAAAIVGFVLFAPGRASAQSCYPHCDYVHYYGPRDYTYMRPGLYGYPNCTPRGTCTPFLTYRYSYTRDSYPTLRFTVRPRRQVRTR